MALQLRPNVTTAYRVETTYGTLATNDSTARFFRTNEGAGLSLTKKVIPSNEIRSTLDRIRPRHGNRAVAGSLAGDLSLTSYDPLIEAAFRGTFSAVLTSASFTAGYVASTGILTRGTGSFVGEGYKIGDVVYLAGANVAAQANIPLVLTAVGSTTCTVGNKAAITDITSAASTTLVRPKKVIQASSPVLRGFSIEHWEPLAPNSERYTGCRIDSMALSMPTDGMVGVEFGFRGLDRSTSASQYFTSATGYTTSPMASVDTVVVYNGTQTTLLQNASLTLGLNTEAPEVVGSAVAPNVFDGLQDVTAQLTFMKQDQVNISAFQSESGPFAMTFLYKEVGTNGFIAFSIPAFTIGSATTGNRIGASGPQSETVDLLIGVGTGSDRDASMLTCITSAT